jgi:hypothetical protein
MNNDHVDTASWLRALADVESLNPKFIIPGHGKPSTVAKQAIAFTRDYIEYVRGAMSNIKRWRTGSISMPHTSRPIVRNTRACPPLAVTIEGMPIGSFWSASNQSSRMRFCRRSSGARADSLQRDAWVAAKSRNGTMATRAAAAPDAGHLQQ